MQSLASIELFLSFSFQFGEQSLYPAALSLLEQNLRACQNLEIFLTQVSEGTLALTFFLVLFLFLFFVLFFFQFFFFFKELSIKSWETGKVLASFKPLEHPRTLIMVSSKSFMLDLVAEVFVIM